MRVLLAPFRWTFRVVRSVVYLIYHGEDDMVEMYGRNPNGGDNEALRLGAGAIGAGASPGGAFG